MKSRLVVWRSSQLPEKSVCPTGCHVRIRVFSHHNTVALVNNAPSRYPHYMTRNKVSLEKSLEKLGPLPRDWKQTSPNCTCPGATMSCHQSAICWALITAVSFSRGSRPAIDQCCHPHLIPGRFHRIGGRGRGRRRRRRRRRKRRPAVALQVQCHMKWVSTHTHTHRDGSNA